MEAGSERGWFLCQERERERERERLEQEKEKEREREQAGTQTLQEVLEH